MENIIVINKIISILAFLFLAFQIFLGSFKNKVKLHMLNGIFVYSLIVVHIFLMIFRIDGLSSSFGGGKLFYYFVDVCLLCEGRQEHYINFARVAFLFITFSVMAIKLKKFTLFLQKKCQFTAFVKFSSFLPFFNSFLVL